MSHASVVNHLGCLICIPNVSVLKYSSPVPIPTSNWTSAVSDFASGTLFARGALEVNHVEVVASPTNSSLPFNNRDGPLPLVLLSVPQVPGAGEDAAFQINLVPDMLVLRGPAINSFTLASPLTHDLYRINLDTPITSELEGLHNVLARFVKLDVPTSPLRNTMALVAKSGEVVGTLATSTYLDTRNVNPDASGPVRVSQAPVDRSSGGDSVPGQWTISEPPPPKDNSTEAQLLATSEMVGDWLIYGAGLFSNTILKASAAAQTGGWVTPNATPLVLTASRKTQIQYAKSFSENALKVTGAIVSGAASAAYYVGSAVATQLRGTSSTLASDKSTTARTIKLTSALIRSLAVLGTKASVSGRMMVTASGTSAANIIEHKYGLEAGAAARDLTKIAENVWMIYFDSKGLARMVILTSAKSTVQELAGSKKDPSKPTGDPVPKITNPYMGSQTPANTVRPTSIDALAKQALAYAMNAAPAKVSTAVTQHGPKMLSVASSVWAKANDQLGNGAGKQPSPSKTNTIGNISKDPSPALSDNKVSSGSGNTV